MSAIISQWKKDLRPKAGWGVPVAWLTLCIVWSSTWLVIKVGLRDLPPISYAAIRFVIAVIVLLAVSAGRVRLLPQHVSDYVLLKARVLQVAPGMIAAWQMIFGAAPLLVTGLVVEGNPLRFHWSALSIFCLLYLAVIGSALTFLLLYWLLPRMSVAKLQTVSLITPPGAVLLGWTVGGEKFSLLSLLGACFVLAGVWMIFSKAEVMERATQRADESAALPRG